MNPDTPMTAIAEAVKHYRTAQNISQADLATNMSRHGHKWSQSTVNEVENCQRSILAEELIILAALLEFDITMFVPAGIESNGRNNPDQPFELYVVNGKCYYNHDAVSIITRAMVQESFKTAIDGMEKALGEVKKYKDASHLTREKFWVTLFAMAHQYDTL